MTNSQLEDFIEILNGELDLLTRLHSTLVDQQKSLVSGDVEQVSGEVKRQIEIVGEIGRLEERRKATLQSIAPTGEDGIDLERIIGDASEEQAVRIRGIVDRLKEALESLGTVNKCNGMLIRQSMSYIDKTMKMIAGGGSPTETYTSEGGIECPTRQVALDEQI
jgi:flagellar biosynthesis/type III secretory pathway chaperone